MRDLACATGRAVRLSGPILTNCRQPFATHFMYIWPHFLHRSIGARVLIADLVFPVDTLRAVSPIRTSSVCYRFEKCFVDKLTWHSANGPGACSVAIWLSQLTQALAEEFPPAVGSCAPGQ